MFIGRCNIQTVAEVAMDLALSFKEYKKNSSLDSIDLALQVPPGRLASDFPASSSAFDTQNLLYDLISCAYGFTIGTCISWPLT